MATIPPIPSMNALLTAEVEKYRLQPEEDDSSSTFLRKPKTSFTERREAKYAGFMLQQTKNFQNASFWDARSGDKAVTVAKESSLALQTLSRDTKVFPSLTNSIASSSLSERKSFAERRARVEEGKNKVGQCIKNSNGFLDASLCVARSLQELPQEERMEAATAIPKALAGRVIDTVAVPLALVSEGTKIAFGAVQEYATQRACADQHAGRPGEYLMCMKKTREALEGRNPQVNEAFRKGTPASLMAVGKGLSKVDDSFEAADHFMAQEYYTHEGLIHSALEGATGVGTGVALGAAVKLSKTATQAAIRAIKPAMQCARDIQKIKKITKAVMRPLPGETVSETMALDNRMKRIIKCLPNYSSEQNFVRSLPSRTSGPILLQNTNEVLPPLARGRSRSTVSFVEGQNRVIKDFTLNSRLAQELIAYEKMRQLHLAHWKLPQLHKVGKLSSPGKADRGLIAMTKVPGRSLAEIICDVSQCPMESVTRYEKFANLLIGIEKSARGLVEFHKKGLSQGLPSAKFLKTHIEKVYSRYDKGHFGSASKQDLKRVIKNFKQNPGMAGLTHCDVHLGNFLLRTETGELFAIDFGSCAKGLSALGKPMGVPAMDLAGMSVRLDFYGCVAGLSKSELASMQHAFWQGYKKTSIALLHTKEALDFYECYWSMYVLSLKELPEESVGIFMKRLNDVCLPNSHTFPDATLSPVISQMESKANLAKVVKKSAKPLTPEKLLVTMPDRKIISSGGVKLYSTKDLANIKTSMPNPPSTMDLTIAKMDQLLEVLPSEKPLQVSNRKIISQERVQLYSTGELSKVEATLSNPELVTPLTQAKVQEATTPLQKENLIKSAEFKLYSEEELAKMKPK